MARPNRSSTIASAAADEAHPAWALLTRAALVLLLALVVARATTMEFLRDPLSITPGGEAIPRGAGPAAGVVLDWLCLLPALLVLIRRAGDRAYALRGYGSLIPVAALALWAACSVGWSNDRFAAAIGASHWWAAVAVLFAGSQLVRDWRHVRVTAAVIFGLLLVFIAHGAIYRYVELPDLQRSWHDNRLAILAERGWEEGSYPARQFANRIESGDMSGFAASPNTFAAVLALAVIVAFGVIAQRLCERPLDASVALPILGALAGWWLILFTRSKAGYLSPALALATLALLVPLRRLLARHWRLAFVLALGAVAICFVAVVGHGVYHGSLPTDSMNFRWRYWVGSWRLFQQHPLLGVGWNSFGEAYLGVRLPVAAEEIKDPHNFLVRVAVELGIVGFLLLLAWLVRLAWELSRPHFIDDDARRSFPRQSPIGVLAAVGLTAFCLSVAAGIDFDQPAGYWSFELLRRFLYLCVFLLGSVVVLARSLRDERIDARPAPWIVHGLILAAGLFLVHNLIDFSMFDTSPGPLLLFALTVGTALGARRDPAPTGSLGTGRFAAFILAPAAMACFAAAFGFVAPLLSSESLARQGDAAVRAGHPLAAVGLFTQAADRAPVANADYPLRAAASAIRASLPPRQVLDLLGRAIAAEPGTGSHRLTRARFLLSLPDPAAHRPQILADYTAATAANPNEVSLHIEYGDALRRLHLPQQAAEQYRLALHYDDLLPPDEPKRLSVTQAQQLRNALQEMTR